MTLRELTVDEMRADPDAVERILAYSDCSDRDRKVVRLIASGASYKTAGEAVGLSGERVRQLSIKALRRGVEIYNLRNIPPDESTSVKDVDLPIRVQNGLMNSGIKTVGQLRAYVDEHGLDALVDIPNFGMRSIKVVSAFLRHLSVTP